MLCHASNVNRKTAEHYISQEGKTKSTLWGKQKKVITVKREVLAEDLVTDGPGHEFGQQRCVTLHCRILKTRHLANLESYAHWISILHISYIHTVHTYN